MSRHVGQQILEKCILPFVDTSSWEFFDLSVHNRHQTGDAVLEEVVEAGLRLGVVCKEPTVTPTPSGLQGGQALPSANVVLRKRWRCFVISRDTINVEGLALGFQRQVLFDRQAVGGEYGALSCVLGRGTVELVFRERGGQGQEQEQQPRVLASLELEDRENAVVMYHNPFDDVVPLAHHFFSRCLEAGVRPIVVTKKTVFRWQEGFWQRMKTVYDEHYKHSFAQQGIHAGDLEHLLTDAASMAIIKWKEGGFGMVAHNYDGDILTDEIAQAHGNPGLVSSVITGMAESGRYIKQHEAVHGTAADQWSDHLEGRPTSFNPLGMLYAVIGAMQSAAKASGSHDRLIAFCSHLTRLLHQLISSGNCTSDLSPSGLSTDQFIDLVNLRLRKLLRR